MSAPRLPAIFLNIQRRANTIPAGQLPAQNQGMKKLMLTLRHENFHNLMIIAESRGISIQELLRAVIIPEWTKATGRTSARPTVPWRNP